MQEIKLNAKLRAYSNAPYYTDWVRDVSSQSDIPNAEAIGDIAYARAYNADGKLQWVKIDTSLLKPETIQDLIELVNTVQEDFNDVNNHIDNVQDTVNKIDLDLQVTGPYSNQLIFTDAKGIIKSIKLPSSYPDKKTINENDETLLYVIDTADNNSIKIVNETYKDIYDDFNNLIGQEKVSGSLRAEKLYVESNDENDVYISGKEISDNLSQLKNSLDEASKNINDLENYVQGKGGFIDPHKFGSSKYVNNAMLNQYYYDLKGKGNPIDIPDQTKVKNLDDGHIWVYVEKDDTWVDEGADVVVNANNDGVLGVVTGSELDYKVSIDSEGIMTVNGVEEQITTLRDNKLEIIKNELNSDAVYVQDVNNDQQKLLELSDNIKSNTVAMRTDDGTILSNTVGNNIYETVNINWLNNLFATAADIESIKPVMGDN